MSGNRHPTSQSSIRSSSPPVARHFFQDRISFVLLRLREVRNTFQGFRRGLDDTQETLENLRRDFEQADGRLELVRDECDLAHGRLDRLREELQPANDRLEQLHSDFQVASGSLERLHGESKLSGDRLSLHELDMAAIRITIKELGMAVMRLNDFVGTLSHAYPLPHQGGPRDSGASSASLCHGIAIGDDGAPANGCPHFRDDCPLRFSYHAETNAPKIEISD